jgi:hypothetical protein
MQTGKPTLNQPSEQERLQQAQALLNEMAQKYGVTLAVTTTSSRVDDGAMIVRPQVTLQLIPEWKAPENGDH